MLHKLQVRTRLLLMLAFVNVLLLAAVGFGWHAIVQLNGQLDRSVAQHGEYEAATDRAQNAQVQFKSQVLAWKNLLLRGQEPGQMEYYEKAFNVASAKVQENLAAARIGMRKLGLAEAPAERAIALHNELGAKYSEALKALKSGASVEDADKVARKVNSVTTEQIDGLAKAIQEKGAVLSAQIVRSAAEERSRLEYQLLALAVFAVLFSAAAGWALVTSISRPLERATQIARTVAAGNLTEKIEVGRTDEFGQLLLSLKNMNDALAAIVQRVRENSQSVMSASTQIAAGNRDLSSRTEEQASSLEETAASIEEMTATVHRNAQNSLAANDFVASAAQVAERGGAAVEQMVRTMDDIQQRSRKIADIVGVVDSIAFQTNILALNAAVEAARAGEQGRGFAVVASEVRILAQRSAQAAKEIKALITDSVERVDSGARLATDAGTTMVELVASVRRISEIIGDIARATQEQNSGITQVSLAASHLDKATQENAALVEQSTVASEGLMRMAREMEEAVATFRLDDALAPLERATPQQPARPAASPARLPDAPAGRGVRPAGQGPIEEEWKEF